MAATKPTSRKREQRKRVELRFDMGCYPPSWRRFIIAGATVCHTIQALALTSQHLKKGEDEHDCT